MRIKKLFIILLLPAFVFLSACRQRKEIQKAKAEEKPIVIPPSFSLADSLNAHKFKFKTMSAKIKTEFKGNDGSEISLMITMRAVSDSAIWMSASPALGIEAARIIFTTDSIKIMDKINGTYARESYSFLKKFSDAEITYDMLQNILIGNTAFSNSPFLIDSITNYYYAHSSQNALTQELTITKLYKIFNNILNDNTTQDTILVNYGDFQYVENEYLPFDIGILAKSKDKTASIKLNYTNVSINAPVEIRFNIPSSYSKMKY